MTFTPKLAICASLWAISAVLGVDFVALPFYARGLGVLSVLLGQVALAFTFSIQLERHRMRVAQILAVAEAEAAAHKNVTSIH